MSDFSAKEIEEILLKIEMRIAELGMSKGDFYEKSKISSASFSQWKTGTHKPTKKKIADAAKVLDTSLGYLLGTEDKKEEPTVAGGLGALIPGYDELSVEHKADAIRYIEFLLQKQKGEA